MLISGDKGRRALPIDVLVTSSTVYNEIPGEPALLVVPIFDRGVDVAALTDVNTLLVTILATPDQ